MVRVFLDCPAMLGHLKSTFVPLWFLLQLIPGVNALRRMELQQGWPAWVMAQQRSTQPCMLSLLLMQCLQTLEACSLLTLLTLLSFPHILGGFRAPVLAQASSDLAPSFIFCLYHLVCLARVLFPWAWAGLAAASCTACQLLLRAKVPLVQLQPRYLLAFLQNNKICMLGPKDLWSSFCLWLCIFWSYLIIISSAMCFAGSLHIFDIPNPPPPKDLYLLIRSNPC